MIATACPHCGAQSARPGDVPAPWCRTCGGALTPPPPATPAPAESLVSLTPAPPAPRRWDRQRTRHRPADTPAPRVGRPPRDPAPAPASDWRADLNRQIEEQVAREVGARPPAVECYLFAVACALLPVATLGGALWFALGFGGASTCAKIAHSHTLSRPVKWLACLAVTAGAWGLFLLLLVVLAKVAPRR